MGVAIFLIIAFVMFGVERLVVNYRRSHPMNHGVVPRS
jgi:hypothetical protein